MEDSFRVRVDKIFGSLGGGGNTASSPEANPSLWSLTDEEIERRKWNRLNEEEEDDDDESGPSDLLDPLKSDLQLDEDEEELDEEDEEEIDVEKKGKRRGDVTAISDEDWDVQSNIGRDCTLDYEEEEDEFDKVAVGTDQTGDRIYMKDVKVADYGIDEVSTYGELPNSFHVVTKDPRANHDAAKIRLKEDAEATGEFDTSQISDDSVATNVETVDVKKRERGGENPKPILKKRDNMMDSRSQKRVRFLCDPKSSSQNEEGASALTSGPCSGHDGEVREQVPDLSQYTPGIPDYVRNPSKYTCYTLDSSDDMDDQSNKTAVMEFFQQLRNKSTDNASPVDTSVDIPKSITFTPKMKPKGDSIVKRSESEHNTGDNLKNKGWSVGFTAEDAQESDVSAMEEDEPSLPANMGSSLLKPGRQYRARTSINRAGPTC
ncbi:hypothetical protein ACJIZ3_019442 [Penstemon smallii]|uniref:U5 small nuclear ribonucleoprotein TSSC4 n=1 Tax=Penstemon smallii TaxID=265156 RepID=A0ABD3T1P5_9LAMI